MTVFDRKQVGGLVLVRDGALMVADGVSKILESSEPETQLQYDIMKIVTRQTEGPSGVYLKASEEDNRNNPDYEALLEDLKQHDGKLTRQGYFCWLFDDNTTAGMKLSKK